MGHSSAIERGLKIARRIRHLRSEIISNLTAYESHHVANDEIERTLDLLENLFENQAYLAGKIDKVVSFLPINQPLYALACFGIAPSFMAKKVHVRPPAAARDLFIKLQDILGLRDIVPNLHIRTCTRRDFLADHTNHKPDAVIFTGKPENARATQKLFGDDVLFIGNGSSHNPVIVAPDADLTAAIEGVVEVQLYNQGGDCAAPNSILVHKAIFDDFIHGLAERLKIIGTGPYRDPSVLVGPMTDKKNFQEVVDKLLSMKNCLYPTPEVTSDPETFLLYPTIVLRPLVDGGNYTEWFAPIFFIQQYDSDNALAHYFESPLYADNAGYVTLYGTSTYVDNDLMNSSLHSEETVIRNTHLHAPGIERGTKPYGGYGRDSSFISYKGRTYCKPTLPQRDIFEFLIRPSYDWERIRQEFEQAAVRAFNSELRYIFFSGSVAYGGGIQQRSDIDVALVLSNTHSTQSREHRLKQYLAFGQQYSRIHSEHSFVPDELFPGEFLTQGLIDDAISGRGFSVQNDELFLPEASVAYYLTDTEHWFRAWLSMTAFSVFGSGSYEDFQHNKTRAWKSVILYLASSTLISELNVESIIELLTNEANKWIGFGVTKNYKLFETFESPYISEALAQLAAEGYAFPDRNARYRPVETRIQAWKRSVISKLLDGSIRHNSLLTNLADTQTIAAALRSQP